MTSLYSRLTGRSNMGESLELDESDPEDRKMPGHSFTTDIYEWVEDYVTAGEVLANWPMNAEQQDQANQWRLQINACTDKPKCVGVLHRWILAGEEGTHAKYCDEVQLDQRLTDEIVDQGGTPPANALFRFVWERDPETIEETDIATWMDGEYLAATDKGALMDQLRVATIQQVTNQYNAS